MDIKEILNMTDRFAAAAGCQITEVTGIGYRKNVPLPEAR
ncbi:hypothetical protein SAMN04487851_102194 [Prevotella sp. tc2-28]|nr:hypothetical protein SAMN04487851_102194 [Prevotella sp. tc2-28]